MDKPEAAYGCAMHVLLKRCFGIVAVVALGTAAAPARRVRNEAPAVSPDGTRVAFLSNRDGNEDVYVVGRDGTNEVRLTNTPDDETRPAWSSDGKHVWFSVFANDVSRIYSVDPDGRNLKQIGSVPGRAATLSHDGKRVLYATGEWTAVRLAVSNLDGSEARILADHAPVLWNVQWSPDDKLIAYTGRSSTEKALSVWIMNADGSNAREIAHLAPEDGNAQVPAWSADGRRIAIQANHPDRSKHDAHIWVVDLQTGAAHDITPHPAEPYLDEVPSWFPDGKQIAYQSDRSGWMEIWVMNADGSNQHQLVPGHPLRSVPATTITVRWSVPPDMAAYPLNTPAACASAPARRTSADAPVITIWRCGSIAEANDAWRAEAGVTAARNRYVRVRQIALDRAATSGKIAVEGLGAGAYLLRLDYHDLPPAFATLDFNDFNGTGAVVDLDSKPERYFGRVTRDGKPYHAFVALGDGAVSDQDTGEYVALASPLPKSDPAAERRFFKDPNPISVRGCDARQEINFVPEAAPIPNSRFDIDLTPATVHVSVVDAASGAAIDGAAVTYRVMRRDDVDVTLFEGAAVLTDTNGKSHIDDLPQKRRIVVCASHEHYSSACAPPITLDASSAEVSVSLTRSDSRRGTVTNAPAAGGRVVWITPAGDISDSSTIAADGSFTYARPHKAGELVCVVSAAAPLLVLRHPRLAPDESFDISYAGIAVRDFHAVLPPAAHEAKGFLGISIGDAVVPLAIFSEHLAYRGSRPVFLAPRTIEVPQIAVTAPVAFLFAPISWAEANSGGRGVDFFYLPAARALPRAVPDSRGIAVVGE